MHLNPQRALQIVEVGARWPWVLEPLVRMLQAQIFRAQQEHLLLVAEPQAQLLVQQQEQQQVLELLVMVVVQQAVMHLFDLLQAQLLVLRVLLLRVFLLLFLGRLEERV
jgi:hypothetical protein